MQIQNEFQLFDWSDAEEQETEHIVKLTRDYKVGVIVCTNGVWYSHHENQKLLFSPDLIQLIESEEYRKLKNEFRCNIDPTLKREAKTKIKQLFSELIPYPFKDWYLGLTSDCLCYLEVEWIPIDTLFKVEQVENEMHTRAWEEIQILDDSDWITA